MISTQYLSFKNNYIVRLNITYMNRREREGGRERVGGREGEKERDGERKRERERGREGEE